MIEKINIIESRKHEHIEKCLKHNVEHGNELFTSLKLPYSPLPEHPLHQIDTTSYSFGKTFSIPLFISGITGGTEDAYKINIALANLASLNNIPFSLGSMKIALQHAQTLESFNVKKHIKSNLFLIGNIGLHAFNYGMSIDALKKLSEYLGLDCLALHLNPLQEAIQGNGETNFSNSLKHIELIMKKINIPIMIKEVGCGIPTSIVRKLFEAGVNNIDVGGIGGTSWTKIEGLRGDPIRQRIAKVFLDTGLTTEESLKTTSSYYHDKIYKPNIYATGGIRNGLQIAKAVYLGATMCGAALPFLKAYSKNNLQEEFDFFEKTYRIALYTSGHHSTTELMYKYHLNN